MFRSTSGWEAILVAPEREERGGYSARSGRVLACHSPPDWRSRTLSGGLGLRKSPLRTGTVSSIDDLNILFPGRSSAYT